MGLLTDLVLWSRSNDRLDSQARYTGSLPPALALKPEGLTLAQPGLLNGQSVTLQWPSNGLLLDSALPVTALALPQTPYFAVHCNDTQMFAIRSNDLPATFPKPNGIYTLH